MSIVQSTGLQRLPVRLPRSLSALSYFPLTEWMPCAGIDLVQAYLSNRAATPANTLEQYLAWQYAAVRPDRPGVWNKTSTNIGNNTEGVTSQALTSTTDYWIRFGTAVRNTSTNQTEVTAEIGSSFEWIARGRVVGKSTIQLDPPGVSMVNYLPVTGWIPAIEAEAVRATMQLTSWVSDLDYQLSIRTAQNPDRPTAWNVIEAGWPNPGVPNTERCTGNISLTSYLSGQQYVQFGIGIKGANGNGELTTQIAVSRS